MEPRIDPRKVAPDVLQALAQLDRHVRESGLLPRLVDLVYLRVSLLNGCAYCVDMHSKDLRAAGETDERVYSLSVWRETPYYDEREGAALAWAEAVTTLGGEHVGDDVFELARRYFSAQELVALTLAVATINAWNRIAIACRLVPGAYVAKRAA